MIVGMIGLGTMGRNLLPKHGRPRGKRRRFDKDASKGALLEQESKHGNLKGFSDVKRIVEALTAQKRL